MTIKASINLDPNVISFAAHNINVDVHKHYCFQIVVSLNSTFDCTIAEIPYTHKKGFILNQNITHSCLAQHTSVLVYFIEAESYLGWQLRELLGGQPFLDIEPFFDASQQNCFFAEGNQFLPKDSLKQMADEVLAILLGSPPPPGELLFDERISAALDFIDAHFSQQIELDDIANAIYLSPERIRHLFVQQVGVPFSQYLLWKRIKNVIVVMLRDKLTLTKAALASGFADQPHFNRIFKRTFGISPKPLLKDSRFVQFLNPLT